VGNPDMKLRNVELNDDEMRIGKWSDLKIGQSTIPIVYSKVSHCITAEGLPGCNP
jgi:hypothetical protein